MPSFLDVDTSNAPELKAVPGDKEYKIRIIGFIEKEVDGSLEPIWPDKNGKLCFMPMFEIPAIPDSKEFNTYLPLPNDEMTEKEQIKAARRIEDFKQCFRVPKGKVDLKKLIGNEGWAILNLKDDPEYGEQNGIKKFMTPKK